MPTRSKPLHTTITGSNSNILPVTASGVGFDLTNNNFVRFNPNFNTWVAVSTGGGSAFPQKQFIGARLTVNSTTPVECGQFYWSGAEYTSPPGTVYFRVVASVAGNVTGSFQIYNLTSGSYVVINGASTYINVSSSSPVFLTSSNLVGAINFADGHIYELQLSCSNGNFFTNLGGAELFINT